MVKNPLSLLFIIGVCKPIYFVSINLKDIINFLLLRISSVTVP